MTLRDEIARAVARAVDRAMDGERAMTPPPLGGWHPLVTDAVDDIMTAVREALLRDEAVCEEAAPMYDVAWIHHPTENGRHVAGIRAAITAALDAVAGEDDER